MSRALVEAAIAVETQDAANVMFEQLVQEAMRENDNMGRAEAIDTVRDNLGYFAGYYDHDTRARVERLYQCEHPVFGPIATTRPPSAEEALALVKECGKRGRIITLAEFRKASRRRR
jgi:hypothetical protein